MFVYYVERIEKKKHIMEIIKIDPIKPQSLNEQPEGKEKLRVAAYCRVSTDDDEQLKSYNSMVKYYEDKIKEQPNWEYAGIYADFGVTGTSTKNRTEFNRMMDDANAGKIDYIITKSISRFARNNGDIINSINTLRNRGIYVFFEEETIDSASPGYELILTVLGIIAQQEVENTSAHVTKGLYIKMSRGELVGFNKCLGYDYDKETKQLSVNPEEAELVRYIFDRYNLGIGSTEIARELNEKGLRTIKGNEWGSSTIMSILKNEKYIGDLRQGKTYTNNAIEKHRACNRGERQMYYVKDHHEPIIDREIWDKARAIHKIRIRGRTMGSTEKVDNYSRKYAFSSKLECYFCGSRLTRRSWHGEMEEKYKKTIWHCCTYVKKGAQYCPDSKGIEERVIETAFIEAYNLLCGNNQDVVEKFLSRVEKTLDKEKLASKEKKLEEKLSVISNKRQKLVENYLNGTIEKEVYKPKDDEIKAELGILQKEYDQVKAQAVDRETMKKRIESFRAVLSEGGVMTVFDRDIFDRMIDKVIVGGLNENGEKDPYKLTFIFKTGWKQDVDNSKRKLKEKDKAEKCSPTLIEGTDTVLPDKDQHTLSA